MSSCARLFDKARSTIHKAQNNENSGTFADLHLDPIERDKLHNQMPLFMKFVATLPTKSGMFSHLFVQLFCITSYIYIFFS